VTQISHDAGQQRGPDHIDANYRREQRLADLGSGRVVRIRSKSGNMSVRLVAAFGRQGRLVVAPLKRKAGGMPPPLITQLVAHSRPNALKPWYARPDIKDEFQSVRDEIQMSVAALCQRPSFVGSGAIVVKPVAGVAPGVPITAFVIMAGVRS
jgi:hypothetical protein